MFFDNMKDILAIMVISGGTQDLRQPLELDNPGDWAGSFFCLSFGLKNTMCAFTIFDLFFDLH